MTFRCCADGMVCGCVYACVGTNAEVELAADVFMVLAAADNGVRKTGLEPKG